MPWIMMGAAVIVLILIAAYDLFGPIPRDRGLWE